MVPQKCLRVLVALSTSDMANRGSQWPNRLTVRLRLLMTPRSILGALLYLYLWFNRLLVNGLVKVLAIQFLV